MGAVAVKDYVGSTFSFYPVEEGTVLKSLYPSIAERDAYKVMVEKRILERLGEHSRIVKCDHLPSHNGQYSDTGISRYRGFRDTPDLRGLLLAEASHSDLQNYIDQNNDPIGLPLRQKWCRQLTKAVQHLHRNGVVHSDLRLENCLVHASMESLDILLCDFGGSTCPDLGLDRRGLPDPSFWDMVWESTLATDIFSLGSTFYTIMTGHWPYKSTHPIEEEDKWEYEDRGMASMKQGRYPDVGGMIGGTIMMSCWTKQYVTADEILQALKVEM
jgi:serine/threonine protein kinase